MKNRNWILKSTDDIRTKALKIVAKVFPKEDIKNVNLKDIHDGYTNFSFLFTASDGKMYQIRIPHDNNIINRKLEHEILKKLNDTNFIYFDDKTGIAVKKWVEGKNPTWLTTRSRGFANRVFNLIKKIHEFKIQTKGISTIDYDLYNDNLYRLDFIYQKKFLCLLDRRKDDPKVLNHSDLNPLNILKLKNGGIYFIDFEWSCLNSDYWDYANYIRETNTHYWVSDLRHYIKDFNHQLLKDYLFLSSVYAYLWTYAMPESPKLLKYRKQTLKQIKRYYHGVINYDKSCES